MEGGGEVLAAAIDVRICWEGGLSAQYPQLSKIASRLMSLHATSCATERLWSFLRWVYRANRSSLGVEKARKMALVSFLRRAQGKEDLPFEPDMLLESFNEEEMAALEDSEDEGPEEAAE